LACRSIGTIGTCSKNSNQIQFTVCEKNISEFCCYTLVATYNKNNNNNKKNLNAIHTTIIRTGHNRFDFMGGGYGVKPHPCHSLCHVFSDLMIWQ
jgi:hypothetical protein